MVVADSFGGLCATQWKSRASVHFRIIWKIAEAQWPTLSYIILPLPHTVWGLLPGYCLHGWSANCKPINDQPIVICQMKYQKYHPLGYTKWYYSFNDTLSNDIPSTMEYIIYIIFVIVDHLVLLVPNDGRITKNHQISQIWWGKRKLSCRFCMKTNPLTESSTSTYQHQM